MSKATIDTLEKTIHNRYHMQRKDRNWLLDQGLRLRAPDRHSFGFSLDNANKKPFAFLSDTPPEHVAKMCDAIVAQSYEESLYLFVIEQKTGNPDSFKKQITNGKLFCDWLCALYRNHGYMDDGPTIIALLIWEPRLSPNKGTTTHDSDNGVDELDMSDSHFHHGFQVRNQQNINLKMLIDRTR